MNDNARFSRPRNSLTKAIALCAVLCAAGCTKRHGNRAADAPLSDNEQSKPTNGGVAAEQVAVTDDEQQLPIKIDWDSLRYVPFLLGGDAVAYDFVTSDNYRITLSLSGRVDDKPPKVELALEINLPNIDLKQSPDLQQNLVKAVDRLTQDAESDKVRDRLKYLKKEVLRRSKIPNREPADEQVIVKEDPKQLLLAKQLLLNLDWDSLKYDDYLVELFDGGFIYGFETPDHYAVGVYLSGQTDDMPREEILRLGIDPKIDLKQSPNLLQRVVKAVDRFTQEADIEWWEDHSKHLKQEILRRSKLK